MEKIADEVIIFLLCAIAMGLFYIQPLSVAGLLGAVAITCACSTISIKGIRYALIAALLALCAFVRPFVPFIPIAAYLCMIERPWPLRLSWVAAWAIPLSAGGASASVALILLVMCCIASVLAMRTMRSVSERMGGRRLRDGMREHMLELARSNDELAARIESLESSGGGLGRGAGSHDAPDASAALAASSALLALPVLPVSPASPASPAAPMQSEVERLQAEFAFEGLTDRENAVASLVAEGMDNKEIAGTLYLSEGTVRNHISSILQKKQLKNRTQIAVMYYKQRA